MQLNGKVCLVTGGTKGIGAATAVALAREGADVAIVGRNADEAAAQTKARIEALGRRCEIVRADCAQPAESTRCVEETAARLGAVDVLIHSAGGPVNGKLFDLSEAEWNAAFAIHVHAIFHLCRAVIPMMQTKKEGAIVLIGSTAGLRGVHTNIAYQVVKGALPQFARKLGQRSFHDLVGDVGVDAAQARRRTDENDGAFLLPLHHRDGGAAEMKYRVHVNGEGS